MRFKARAKVLSVQSCQSACSTVVYDSLNPSVSTTLVIYFSLNKWQQETALYNYLKNTMESLQSGFHLEQLDVKTEFSFLGLF